MADIKELQKKIIPILEKNGVVRASVFGSFARGEDMPKSDIDILVELEKNKSLLDMIHLKNELEDLLNQKVDLLTYNSVHPLLKKYIYKDEIKIYAKRS
ncbi:MAG: nucleotidyltransferase family protein [bacterium]|nr:nucleotidyltransferase family protein [bacterium]